MLSYKKYVKALKDMMLSFKGENYDFYKGEVQEVEFVNVRHYKNILSSTDLVPSTKEEMKVSRIPVIYPPAVTELINIEGLQRISVPLIEDPLTETADDDDISNVEYTTLDELEDVVFEDVVVVEEDDDAPEDDEPDVNEEFIEKVELDEFICPHCSAVYKTERGLNRHIASKHADLIN